MAECEFIRTCLLEELKRKRMMQIAGPHGPLVVARGQNVYEGES